MQVDAQDFGEVKPYRVGAIGGASGEDAFDGIASVASGVDFEDRTMGLMEPGEEPDVLTGLNAVESFDEFGTNLERGIGSAL